MKLWDQVLFTRRLADLTGGGLTLHRSLDVLSRQSQSPAHRALLYAMKKDLENGLSFSDALAARPGEFGPLYTGLVRAGEQAGRLEPSLMELADFLENRANIQQKIQTALIYPLLLLALTAVVSLFLIFFVIPRFELLFEDMGQSLPWPTRFLLALGHGARYWLAGLLLIPLILQFKRRAKNRLGWRSLLFLIPGAAGWVHGAVLSSWAQTMASLLKGGLTVPEALYMSEHSGFMPAFRQDLHKAGRRVREGQCLSQALECSSFITPAVRDLIDAGEESGRLEDTFLRISRMTQKETEAKTQLGLSLLEPGLILMMGLVVGFVAVAMLLPIFEMSASLR